MNDGGVRRTAPATPGLLLNSDKMKGRRRSLSGLALVFRDPSHLINPNIQVLLKISLGFKIIYRLRYDI